MTELHVFKPVEPVGKCGKCDSFLYPHSVSCHYYDCPVRGEEWCTYKRNLDMRNTYIRKD